MSIDDNPQAKAVAHAIVGAALAAAQGQNAAAAAAGAATGEITGMIASSLYGKSGDELTESQKQTVSALATLASGLAGGLAGNSTASAAYAAQAGKTTVENNDLGIQGFGTSFWSNVQAQGSLVNNTNLADENGKVLNPATSEQIKYASDKLVTGVIPEGQDITKTIVEGYKDGVLILGAAYLGPAASVAKVVAGAAIAEIANGTYQWFDINSEKNQSLPENQRKTWDYWGSASSAITGGLAPGRSVWQNTGIAAGGALFTDGPDIGSIGGAALGAWFGGKFGELAPFPGEVNDMIGGIGGELISNKVKDKVNDN